MWNNTMKWCLKHCDDTIVDYTLLFEYLEYENNTRVNEVSAIHIAATGTNIEIMSILLDHGFPINSKDNNGATPLHWAASNGNIKMINYLTERKANADLVDQDNNTILHYSVEKGYLETSQLIVDVLNVDIHLKNKKFQTALEIACLAEDNELIDYLISKGSSILPPLYTSIERNTPKVAYQLMKCGSISPSILFETSQPSPLHLAVHLNRTRMVKILLRYAFWLTNFEDRHGQRPIDLITERTKKTLLALFTENTIQL